MRTALDRLPLVASLRSHDREAVASDLAAGATVGVMLVPQGMAYALIAGLPPVYGLYAALVPLAVYALFGTSKQLAVGPVAMVALLVADGISPLADGDPQRYVALALALAALVGVIQLTMGLVGAGFLVNLLSHPVLAGFTSAAALIIATSQLGGLTGLAIPKGPVHEMVTVAASRWSEMSWPTLAMGLSAIGLGFALKRWVPRLPGPMIVVVVGTVVSWGASLHARGVAVVAEVPSGLPAPGLPGLLGGGAAVDFGPSDVTALLPVALAISLVGFMESIAVAKVYASRFRYDIDADQELKALGLANLAGSLFQAFPVTGGFSRTAVNAQAGARSQLSSLVSVAIVAVTLLFLTPLFYHLPKAILAAIIVVAVVGLVDMRGARELWRVDRKDFALMAATFAATLLLGIEEGILIGAALSMTVVLEEITRPHIAELGRVPETRLYRNLRRRPDAEVDPLVGVVRMDASLFYGNAEAFKDAARACFERTGGGARGRRTLVLDAYPMNRTDSTGLHVLHELIDEIHRDGGRVYMSGVKGPLHDKLLVGGVVDRIGPEHFFPEVWMAVDAARGEDRRTSVATPASPR
ncbi:MAG: sulfate permease [Longimicrobiales bacterium]|nr:sulfate permease [Longimicrobiales bacterium]